MDRIIINVVDRKSEYVKRIVLDVKATLTNCDFITLGDELMFDRDTDFFTFGFDVGTGDRQLAVVTGDFIPLPPIELIGNIKKSLADRYEVIEDKEDQLWLREKAQ